MPLTIKAQSGEEINVNDTVLLRDGTYPRVKGEAGDLLHHTGGFTPAKDVMKVDHRFSPKDFDRSGYLGIVARSGEVVKVGDVVKLMDETLTTVKGQTGDLMEHTGGFCTSSEVLKVDYRPPTKTPNIGE